MSRDPGPDAPGARRGLRGLLSPSRLRPVELDLRRVFLAGTGLWLLAGAVTGALLAAGRVEATMVAICGAGAVLGLVALAWERRRRPAS